MKTYRDALRFNGKQADAYVGLALVDIARGDRKGALKHARQAASASGKDAYQKFLAYVASITR